MSVTEKQGKQFRVVRGKDEVIQKFYEEQKKDGYVYFAHDTKQIYLGESGKLIPMGAAGGGSGVEIYYGSNYYPKEDEETKYFLIPYEYLDNQDEMPQLNDLILMSDNNSLFRVEKRSEEGYLCKQISGGGGGGGSSISIKPSVVIKFPPSKIINKSSAPITFTATSMKDEFGQPLDDELRVTYVLEDVTDSSNPIQYKSDIIPEVYSGKEFVWDVGPLLRPNIANRVTLYFTGDNHDTDSPTKKSTTITTTELSINYAQGYSQAITYPAHNVNLSCYVTTAIDSLLELYVDDNFIDSRDLNESSDKEPSFNFATSHGAHLAVFELYQKDANGEKTGNPVVLKYEFAALETGNKKPIIWLGQYKDTYATYDDIQIPFFVWSFESTNKVVLYKKGIDYAERDVNIETEYIWEIVDADELQINKYQISCGDKNDINKFVQREITFEMITDASRSGMVIARQERLKLDFNAKGRSNDEPKAIKESWSFTDSSGVTKHAKFINFNWLNNGWMMDNNRQSYLKISNGARLEIPLGSMTFNGGSDDNRNFSMEIQFKISNIQNYNNLIRNITRYKNDTDWYNRFLVDSAAGKFDNYDAWLQANLDPETYDKLEFQAVQKNIDLSNIACGYYTPNNNVGIAIGTQDTFFSNGLNTLSVPFVENDLITLSYVYDYKSVTYTNGNPIRYMYIYVNGVISGVIESKINSNIMISPENGNLFFTSNSCDIDLYRIRVYNDTLNVYDVVVNYAVDHKDPNIFDQTQIAKRHLTLDEYQIDYTSMLTYNTNHPDMTLMPYIIYDTSESDSDFLPHRKPAPGAKGKKINVEFVNTILDKMYQNGELEELAIKDKLLSSETTDGEAKAEAVKLYYKHHCPSFIAKNIDFTVQGTSSEFYPRRNYKIKTKVSANLWNEKDQKFEEDDVYNIMMNRGPYADIYKNDIAAVAKDPKLLGQEESRCSDGWYMNNYTNGTDRWTMKVDYMESSGSYNAGFASLIGTAYSKHPLEDYLNVITNKEKLNPVVQFTDGSHNQLRTEDYRTSLLGFPVMAFQKKSDGSYLFIGLYRMLLDKGSDVVLGFKPNKNITRTDTNEKMRDVAECWEFSTNARTYTSYRDPWDRVELSFMPPESAIIDKTGLTADGAPLICNHIEYRYTKNEDYLDILQKLVNKETGDLLVSLEDNETIKEDLGFDARADLPAARKAIVDMYKNWEDLTRWVNKTDMEAVNAEGIYSEVKLGAKIFTANKYYTQDNEGKMSLADSYVEGKDYFNKTTKTEEDGTVTEIYTNAYVVNDPSKVYEEFKFYIKDSTNAKDEDDVSYYIASGAFDDTITYYTQAIDPNIASKANRLVELCDELSFDENKTYYNYDKAKTNEAIRGGDLAVTVADISAEEYEPNKYYIAKPVSYGAGNNIRTYHFDTKEYRAEKFTNEVYEHFDMEYLSTYFIATEVFECYDSRGKNCMMATWGPHKNGKHYIWYPIFYDIDTQLGINNTGIPSFEFNVDATENFNFSTSDSILWNNFYRFFKGSYIKNKYNHMKGEDAGGWGLLDKAPLKDGVNTLESWYTFDYNINKNIACNGVKPLIVTNLDEYFKYITITNPKAVDAKVAYLNGEGKFVDPNKEDTTGFFYALQGDRSQSRRQFLTNRLDYIDSWLNVGNYARAGNNRIRGRISANYGLSTNEDERINSDIYLESKDGYFNPDGSKKYEYDAEYWLNLKPIRSSYVTAGDDSANYPSKKYNGKQAVKFELTDLATGIKNSPNYAEQLVYIYGMANMADVGDMSKLYWREFYMEGAADKLTRLKLGHDGVGSDPNNTKWYNKQLNGITLTNLPLLKEANFCNIGLSSEQTLPLSASEKLENFRATGCSNLVGVNFARGVALDTLYLPAGIKSLELAKAQMLTKVIKEYHAPAPVDENDDTLVAEKGLYLEGLFENNSDISLYTINLQGGNLGYGSHDLLRQYHSLKGYSKGGQITMTEVDWCPYSLLTEGAVYDSNKANKYFVDNGHYGFEPFVYVDEVDFKAKIINQELFYDDKNLDENVINFVNDDTVALLKLFASTGNTLYKDASGSTKPEITGIIYIVNSGNQDELKVPSELQQYYPNVRFFFKNVQQAYSAKFVIYNETDRTYEYVRVKSDSSAKSVQKITSGWFSNPYTLYDPEKKHYDFKGWKLLGTPDSAIISEKNWDSQSLSTNVYSYTFCAVFTIHAYEVKFLDQNDNLLDTKYIDYDTNLVVPNMIPYQDDSNLKLKQTYDFQGWSLSKTGKVIDPSTYVITSNETLYATFKLVEDVTKVVHYDWFSFREITISDYGYGVPGHDASSFNKTGLWVQPAEGIILRGKVTIPRTYQGKEVITLNGFGRDHKITHLFMESGNGKAPLAALGSQAFWSGSYETRGTIKYFDFANTSLRIIENYAFQGCNLDADLLELDSLNDLFYIGDGAFNAGITINNPTTLILPSNVQCVKQGAFAYLTANSGALSQSTLQIGTATNPSKLDLALLTTAEDQFPRFEQNTPGFASVIFYSDLYNSPTDSVVMNGGNLIMTVNQAFEFYSDLSTEISVL